MQLQNNLSSNESNRPEMLYFWYNFNSSNFLSYLLTRSSAVKSEIWNISI